MTPFIQTQLETAMIVGAGLLMLFAALEGLVIVAWLLCRAWGY